MKVYDATDTILGRLATTAAKQALLGETVKIVNIERAIVTGDKKGVFNKYKQRREMGGPFKGPFIPRMPDRFVRRVVRGMLPYKQPKGKAAFKRIMCYRGVPESLKKEKLIKIAGADISKLPRIKYVSVSEICKWLGGKA